MKTKFVSATNLFWIQPKSIENISKYHLNFQNDLRMLKYKYVIHNLPELLIYFILFTFLITIKTIFPLNWSILHNFIIVSLWSINSYIALRKMQNFKFEVERHRTFLFVFLYCVCDLFGIIVNMHMLFEHFQSEPWKVYESSLLCAFDIDCPYWDLNMHVDFLSWK